VYERLPETLRTRRIGRVIHELDLVNSTNTSARRVLEERGAECSVDGTVIIAREQSAGRGRIGHTWYSPRDAGLYMSVILCSKARDSAANLLPIAAGLSMAEVLRRQYGLDALIKWPNDIVLHKRKLGGVLVERTGEGAYILGIGLNTNWTAQTESGMQQVYNFGAEKGSGSIALGIRPTALSVELGEQVDHVLLLGRILEAIDLVYAAICRGLSRSIIVRARQRLFGLGYPVHIEHGGYTCGTFEGIDNQGHALVRGENGEVLPIESGEVHFADRN
jgi:BirA family biotin operon repressor/biotin-[acetyl-CoA-carboxylase] ligase